MASVRAADCAASLNGFGTIVGDGFLLLGDASIAGGCAAYNNSDCGFQGGPPLTPGSSVHDCIAEFNGFVSGVGDGFNGLIEVVDCTATNNLDSGIETGTGGHVVRNTCRMNLAAGISATGDGNVIEQNNLNYNGVIGIDTTLNPGPGGNFIAGNRAHFNGYVDPAPFVAQYAFGPPDTFAPISPPGPPVPGPMAFAPSFGGNGNIVY
jgi:hypothetical protein